MQEGLILCYYLFIQQTFSVPKKIIIFYLENLRGFYERGQIWWMYNYKFSGSVRKTDVSSFMCLFIRLVQILGLF